VARNVSSGAGNTVAGTSSCRNSRSIDSGFAGIVNDAVLQTLGMCLLNRCGRSVVVYVLGVASSGGAWPVDNSGSKDAP